MSNVSTTAPIAAPTIPAIPKISVGTILPWLVFAVLLFGVAMYFIGAEEGATTLIKGTAVHEWLHDGRHLLGFPCH